MAQLKDLLVTGASRLIGDAFANKITIQTLADSAGSIGTNGQVLKSNGTNIVWGSDNNNVTGVKGNAESSYRTGQVNLTPANIGALALSGGTMTGALNTANNTWNAIGDDAQLGDINRAGSLGIQGKNGNTGLFFTTYNQTNKLSGGAIDWDGSKFTITGTVATSISGNAATASAANITTSAGRIAYYSDNAGTFTSDANFLYESDKRRIHIEHKSGASPEIQVTYGDTVNMCFGIGSGNTNHGIWDNVADKWMIVADTSGNVVVNGNSETATKLKTARSINGTNFNGSANITTANWGTSRTLTIGSTGKSVNGSGNVSWSLSEIGAAASSHNHATLTIGNKTYNGSTNVSIGIADLGLASTTTFLGITSTDLSNGSTTSPVAIVTGPTTGNVTPTNGSVVMEQTSGEEYIWDGSKWNTMGLASSWALANHMHGNILNNGTITSDTAKASGQHLVITDSNNKVARSNITLGTATTTYLRNDGTWATPANNYVTQNAAMTTAGAYPVILAYNTGTAAVTNTVNKASTLTYNPSTTKLHTPIIELTSASYGETLPSTGSEGQIFFQLSEESGSLDSRYVAKAGDTMTGNLLISKDDTSEAICRSVNSNGAVELLASTNRGLYDRTNTKWIINLQVSDSTVRTQYPLYGAVWNDYAEFRETKEKIEPGRCIREIGDDTLELTTERLMRGCEIVSDTFGFAIGQSKKANTPTAASGRVLAYLYEDRETARQHIGWPVCSGPNGTVSIMTEEEEEKYPSRIIGTISAIPDYDVWYGGSNGDAPIQVNGRIWIRIR